MDFSIIIPSRNRPHLLRQAIKSVLTQTHPTVEVIVVNDGSEGEHESAYADMANEWPGKVRFIRLEKTPRGHGPSFAINRGVEQAKGIFVGFLDDDDYWTDPEHLSRAAASLGDSGQNADLYFSNQYAFLDDRKVPGDHWLAAMEQHARNHYTPNSYGIFNVGISDLMRVCGGKFAHLNTMIVKRDLYMAINGMDEKIRYECEWDFYLRLLTRASNIQYAPHYVSRHNVPDTSRTVNESTGIPMLQKLLSRSVVLDKALLFSPSSRIRQMAAKHKIYTLKKMTELLAKEQKYQQALFYGREARIRVFDIKWRLYCGYLACLALLANTRQGDK